MMTLIRIVGDLDRFSGGKFGVRVVSAETDEPRKLLQAKPLRQVRFSKNLTAQLALERISRDVPIALLIVWFTDKDNVELVDYRVVRADEKIAEEYEFRIGRETMPGTVRPGPTDNDGPGVGYASRPVSPRPAEPLIPPLGNGMLESLRRRQQADHAITTEAMPILKAELAASRKRRDAGMQFTRERLGLRPLGRRRSNQAFVPMREADGGTRDKLNQRKITDLGLTGKRRSGISFHTPPNGAFQAPSTLEELFSSIPNTTSAGAVNAKFDPLQDCLSRTVAKGFQDEYASGEEPHSNQASESPEVNARSSLEEQLHEIVTSPVFETALESRPDADEISRNLNMSLAAGPADMPAYYNFDRLHIAWEDSWTAALSHLTEAQVGELYEKLVEVIDYDAPETSVNAEVNELKELLNDLELAVTAATSTIRSPAHLISWLEQDAGELWSSMTYYEQGQIQRLFDAQVYAHANEMLTKYQHADDELDPDDTNEERYEQVQIRNDATLGETGLFDDLDYPDLLATSIYLVSRANLARTEALKILSDVRTRVNSGDQTSALGRAERLITELQARSDEPYQFDIFLPDSVNFGMISRYRQQWQPEAYQAGDLIGTIPLAPGEKRSFNLTEKSSRTRKSQTGRTGLTSRTEDFSSMVRSEAEIQRKVEQKLHASADLRSDNSATGEAKFLGSGTTGTTSINFGGDASTDLASDSSTFKKDIAESTRKMAQEFRDEHKSELSTEETSSFERTQSREISNPNNEITVTYLFYELQRRFEVSTRLSDIIPVVLVAFEVPNPDEITESWVLQYAWIIRESLLDPLFLPVLQRMRTSLAGDEVKVEILQTQWETQLAIVAELREQLRTHSDLRDAARDAVMAATQSITKPTGSGGSGGGNFGENAGEALEYAALGLTTGVGGVLAKALFDRKEKDDEAQPAMTGQDLGSERDSARQALDWADLDRAQAEGALRESIGALERATERYLSAVTERLDRRTQIDQLLLHIKINIMHYMQAIWRAENADQRYLRLYDLTIPWSDGEVTFTTSGPQGSSQAGPVPEHLSSLLPPGPGLLGAASNEVTQGILDTQNLVLTGHRKLHEVADLDQILGFRGNYAVFRLTEPNLISTYMVQDFLDTEFGLLDPDHDGRLLTKREALEVARCAWERAGDDEEAREGIAEWLVEALAAANRLSQDITIPTGEAFIEALPGAHPILEDFKLRHRAADAERAAIGVRFEQVELLRRAQRIIKGNLGDPDVDKTVRVEGYQGAIDVGTE